MAVTRFPIVIEREESGAWSAYIAGLPVYAQGATRAQTAAAIRRTLRAYVMAHPDAKSAADVQVATVRYYKSADPDVTLTSAAALVGGRTSDRKAAASRANGRLGGRPRMTR